MAGKKFKKASLLWLFVVYVNKLPWRRDNFKSSNCMLLITSSRSSSLIVECALVLGILRNLLNLVRNLLNSTVFHVCNSNFLCMLLTTSSRTRSIMAGRKFKMANVLWLFVVYVNKLPWRRDNFKSSNCMLLITSSRSSSIIVESALVLGILRNLLNYVGLNVLLFARLIIFNGIFEPGAIAGIIMDGGEILNKLTQITDISQVQFSTLIEYTGKYFLLGIFMSLTWFVSGQYGNSIQKNVFSTS